MDQVLKPNGHLSPWVQRVAISCYQCPHWSVTTVEASHDALQKREASRHGCDRRVMFVHRERERERSVLGMRLICPVGQVLRGAGADTITLMLRANPAFPLQRNGRNM